MKKRERVKGAGWATGSDTATVLARVALAAEVDGYCEAKTPEAMTEDDLVQAITGKVRDAHAQVQAYARQETKRVKCGTAWAVKVGRSSWAFRSLYGVHTTSTRVDRALYGVRHDAESARRHLRESGASRPRLVRVTFYEVRRG